jgi:hypothetical protein
VPTLRRALAGKPSQELQRRAKEPLKKLDDGQVHPEVLRGWRALSVLARINTPEARVVLEVIAQGAPDARLTGKARVWLKLLPKSVLLKN